MHAILTPAGPPCTTSAPTTGENRAVIPLDGWPTTTGVMEPTTLCNTAQVNYLVGAGQTNSKQTTTHKQARIHIQPNNTKQTDRPVARVRGHS